MSVLQALADAVRDSSGEVIDPTAPLSLQAHCERLRVPVPRGTGPCGTGPGKPIARPGTLSGTRTRVRFTLRPHAAQA